MIFGENGSPLLLIQSPIYSSTENNRSSAIGSIFLYQQKILLVTESHCKIVMLWGLGGDRNNFIRQPFE